MRDFAALLVGSEHRSGSSVDVTEDRRNSFPLADQRLLATLECPLSVTVHLAPEDPRYVDLQRKVLSKLERAMPERHHPSRGGRQSYAASGGDEALRRD